MPSSYIIPYIWCTFVCLLAIIRTFVASPFHPSSHNTFSSSPYWSMWWLSYLFRMLRHRPSSLRMSATSCLSAAFSRSRKEARTEIWFSFSRRASRERFAASLFLQRRLQYLSSLKKKEIKEHIRTHRLSTVVGGELCQMCDWDLCVFICNCLRLFESFQQLWVTFQWETSEIWPHTKCCCGWVAFLKVPDKGLWFTPLCQ